MYFHVCRASCPAPQVFNPAILAREEDRIGHLAESDRNLSNCFAPLPSSLPALARRPKTASQIPPSTQGRAISEEPLMRRDPCCPPGWPMTE